MNLRQGTVTLYTKTQMKSYLISRKALTEIFRNEYTILTEQASSPRGHGFHNWSPEARREVASKGGKAAHELGTAHVWTSEEAREAARKGAVTRRRRRDERRGS